MAQETPEQMTVETPCDAGAPPMVEPDAPSLDAPRRHKGGAPKGNSNALKTGLRSSKLPPGSEYIAKEVATFGRLAAAATLELRGRVGVWEACVLQTAAEWLTYALKLRRLLRIKGTEITIDQAVRYAKEACLALDQRDKCLAKLGFNKDDDQHSTLYAALPDVPDEADDRPDGEQAATAEAPG